MDWFWSVCFKTLPPPPPRKGDDFGGCCCSQLMVSGCCGFFGATGKACRWWPCQEEGGRSRVTTASGFSGLCGGGTAWTRWTARPPASLSPWQVHDSRGKWYSLFLGKRERARRRAQILLLIQQSIQGRRGKHSAHAWRNPFSTSFRTVHKFQGRDRELPSHPSILTGKFTFFFLSSSL